MLDTRPYCGAMASIMLAGEEDEGRKAVWPHYKRLPKWFIPADWSCWPVLSYDDRELHIVAVASARKGALRRLINGAAKSGLSPVIVCPVGPTMPAILKKWGWIETVVGEGWDQRDEWRPASETGTGTAKTAKPVEGRSPARTASEAGDAQNLSHKPPHRADGTGPTNPTPSNVGPHTSKGAK